MFILLQVIIIQSEVGSTYVSHRDRHQYFTLLKKEMDLKYNHYLIWNIQLILVNKIQTIAVVLRSFNTGFSEHFSHHSF